MSTTACMAYILSISFTLTTAAVTRPQGYRVKEKKHLESKGEADIPCFRNHIAGVYHVDKDQEESNKPRATKR